MYIRGLLIFFFELILYPATLLKVFISLLEFPGRIFGGHLHIMWSVNSDTLVLRLLFWFESCWSPFVVLLFELEFQVLYWIGMERVDSLVLLLILVESLWVSPHLIWWWLSTYSKLFLLCLGMFLVSLISQRLLSWRGARLC